MMAICLSTMMPCIILSIVVILYFYLTLTCSNSIPSRFSWISWPIDAASFQVDSSAMIPDASVFNDQLNDSETMNGLWFWIHDGSLCSSVWSVLCFALPIYICCLFDVWYKDVADVTVSWIAGIPELHGPTEVLYFR